MKKLFFFVAAAATLLTGCSDDDGPKASGIVSFNIDGTTKTYTAMTVRKYGGSSEYWLVVASADDASESISIEVPVDATGSSPDPVSQIKYSAENSQYEVSAGTDLTSGLQDNTNSRLTGIFSGTLNVVGDTAVDPKVITNGTFNIRH